MKFRNLLITVLLLATTSRAAEFPKSSRAFIESRCIECHDADSKKGGLDLKALSTQLDDAPTEARWTYVFDRVQRGEMPPKKKERPPVAEIDGFMKSLGGF